MAKSKYDPDTFPTLAEGYARRGLNDIQIAERLGISMATYYLYQHQYSDFSEGLKKGKKPVDMEVENAFLKRAKGYEYEEKHTTMTVDEKGQPKIKEIKKITKQVAPDTMAAYKWLVNRDRERWRDKQEIEHSGGITITTTNYEE